MIVKTRAVVLHVTEYAEASLIIKAYTASHGLQSFLVNGVRKQKSRFPSNLFQTLSLIEVVAYFKKTGGLHRVSDINASPAFVEIPYDVVKTSMALFIGEVLYKSIREEEPNPELFHFIDHAIQILDLHETNVSRFHLCFMMQLTRYLGFFPSGRFSSAFPWFDLQEGIFLESNPTRHPYYLTKQTSALIDQLLDISLEDINQFKISSEERNQILSALILYYELHQTNGSRIKSHEILMELF